MQDTKFDDLDDLHMKVVHHNKQNLLHPSSSVLWLKTKLPKDPLHQRRPENSSKIHHDFKRKKRQIGC